MKPIPTIIAASLAIASAHAGEQQIHRGMTERQVEAVYGEPDARTVTDRGEEWSYTKELGLSFIPIFGAFHSPKIITVDFNGAGRVRSYSIGQ